jgi:hypothetical protein
MVRHDPSDGGKLKSTLAGFTQSEPRMRDAIAAKLKVSPYKVKQHEVVEKHVPALLSKIRSGEVGLRDAVGNAVTRIGQCGLG